jgi:uncharacterized protein involved in oxidation of intracellular sulfur
MRTLLILNDPPYGGERTYNGVRLASALLKRNPKAQVVLFLMGDAVVAAKKGQATPEGYYNLERMLGRVLLAKGRVLLCGTCMSARGVTDAEVIDGAERSTMDVLAEECADADRVLVF